MPELTNYKHEQVVRNLLLGKSATQSYLLVYTNASYSTAMAAVSKLIKAPKVRARIAELREEAEKKAKEQIVEKVVTDLRNKEVRISKLSELALKIESIFKSRKKLYSKLPGADFKAPGHETGLVKITLLPNGKISSEADTTLIREYKAVIQQINEECGPDRISWEEDDGLKELAAALELSPLTPPDKNTGIAYEGPTVVQ